jgi:CelD/BcsL family acetyltransferase involved in cellulose biosynthesis
MIPLGIDQAQRDSAVPLFAHVRVARLAALSDEDLSAWAKLSQHSGEDSIFATDGFVRPVLVHFDDGAAHQIYMTFDALGECYGVAVFGAAKRLGRIPLAHLSGLRNANRFMGVPLVRKGREAAFWRALLAHLDAMPGAGAALVLDDMPADHRVTRALTDLCAATVRNVEVLATSERAALCGPDDGVAGLSSKREARLRSLERKLARDHGAVEIVQAVAADDVDRWIADFLVLEAKGWKGRAGSALAASPATAALFRDVVCEAAAHGTIACRSLSVGGLTIAMSSYFIGGGHGFGFKCCFDEDYSAYAPGILLLRHIMGELEAERLAAFDSCSAPAEPMINNLWGGRRTMLDLCISLKTPLAGARFGAAMTARRWWHQLKPSR